MSTHSVESVSIRDLRNSGGEVVDRVVRGEHLVVTRDGEQVAQLVPLARKPIAKNELLARWRRLPRVDPAALREDVDTLVDQTIPDPYDAR